MTVAAVLAFTGTMVGTAHAESDVRRSQEGESCVKTNDCAAPLRCLNQTCRPPKKSGRGDSCGRTADCAGTLRCITNICTGKKGAKLALEPVTSSVPERSLNVDLAIGGNFCASLDGCLSPLVYGRVGLHGFVGELVTLGVDLDIGGLTQKEDISQDYWSLRLYFTLRGQFPIGRAELSVGLGLGYIHEELAKATDGTFTLSGFVGNGFTMKVPVSLGYRVADSFSLGAEFAAHLAPHVERCRALDFGMESCESGAEPVFNLQLGVFSRFHF